MALYILGLYYKISFAFIISCFSSRVAESRARANAFLHRAARGGARVRSRAGKPFARSRIDDVCPASDVLPKAWCLCEASDGDSTIMIHVWRLDE